MTHDGMTLPGVPEPAYLDMPLGQFLTALASGTPAPGGGAAALSDAADVPMHIVELAADAAGLASRLAADGNPALRGDAIAAAMLAEAAARSAATMVSINLAEKPDDERHARAESLVADAGRSADATRAHPAALQAPNSMEPPAGGDRRRS